ncbi:IKI3 family-domain-containing protein [Cyathus striatus]|nr:IKI3 family-domain-containing protein [Cyathus striatus]
MRNISLIASQVSTLPNSQLTAVAVDLDESVIYITSEQHSLDGNVDVEVWKVPQFRLGGVEEYADPTSVTMFTSIASSEEYGSSQVLSLRAISEFRKLAAIMRGGDITMISLEEEDSTPEVEGTFESGILSASWSPDESLLAILTGENKLVLMTSSFDIISEAPLHTSDFGEDSPINVGWGSKQTQFHGSLGKSAAQAPTITKVGHSLDDDSLPRISWRGDGAFFVVSSLSPDGSNDMRYRILRVYDRQAALQSTLEAVPGLEHTLCWRPSGNLIASTQRFGFEGAGAGREGRHDIVFFERNGLRHGEFSLRVEDLEVVKAPDSKNHILAVYIEKDDKDIVQLWTTGNYHWYLKHEISASGSPPRFTSMLWHPETASHLILTTKSEVIQRCFAWETLTSPSLPPNDSGLVAVFDGAKILLTPFRTQNVPPPMSSFQLSVSPDTSAPLVKTPAYASFSVEHDTLCILWESGYVELWALHTRLGPGAGKVMAPIKFWSGFVHEDRTICWHQVAILSHGDVWTVLALGFGKLTDVASMLSIEGGKSNCESYNLPFRNGRVLLGTPLVYQSQNGELFTYSHAEKLMKPVSKFPEFCVHAGYIPQDGASDLYVGLGKSGKLFITGAGLDTETISTVATSFTVASDYVIFTTSTHESIYAPFSSLKAIIQPSENGMKELPADWPTRKVERGSKIVVAVPSSMSLVLQMPRGNLETINPRPLVMTVVKQDLNAGNYRKAFFACRKHRIDLTVLVDHDCDAFLQQVPAFVGQVHEVDHLNLFLTMIGRSEQLPDTINKVCAAVRTQLEKIDLKKYVNTILTAHAVASPPDHEAGLSVLLRLRESDPDLVEDAVKYIIFLVDSDRLFDTALGMYDFSLVLLIAQHWQKDPREYLPFLRELRTFEKCYQRFRIDDHLKRFESALRNLSLGGPQYFNEAIAYIEKHQLYIAALSIWKNTDHYEAVLDIYGDWLFERREFRQAAAVFTEARKPQKAIVAHEKALEWQELFDIAIVTQLPQDDIVAAGYRVAEDLISKKRYAEAGRVLLDYAKDVREAVTAFVQGNLFSEARRIGNLNSRPELTEDIIYPASLESRAQISEDLAEMKEQLRKQRNRVRELRIRKVEEPDAFYGTEDTNLHNVDVMTDISMPATAFTRYTVAPTTASRSSKRSSRSKRKQERKVGSGRKGTVDEEEYLLKSLTKLVERFHTSQADAKALLPHMFQFTKEHRDEGVALQSEIAQFEEELRESLDEIWTRPIEDDTDAPQADSWASGMEAIAKSRHINTLDKVSKPELSQGSHWRMTLYDLQ